MSEEVRWAYDEPTGHFIGDAGLYEYWRVKEGEHAGKYAFQRDGNTNIFYCDSAEEARADANRLKKFSRL